MGKYTKEVRAKIMEHMQAEDKNPALFKELKDEFLACWKASDANGDGLLVLAEYKEFAKKNTENMKKRWGDCKPSSDDEVESWYNCCNYLTPSCDGISLKDFKDGMEIIKSIMFRY